MHFTHAVSTLFGGSTECDAISYMYCLPRLVFWHIFLRLIVAAVSYVVIGIIIQAAVRGASGVEVIPNVTFWKDFPFLIKVK